MTSSTNFSKAIATFPFGSCLKILTPSAEISAALTEKGITVFYGQRYQNITDDIDCVVFTSAVHEDNPEYIAMQEMNIPSLSRAQLLGQIMKN